MQLKVTTRTKDGILIVDCIGRIVFGEESSLLRETVKKAVSENNRIVMNLGEVSYIDSGGLGTLVALRTTAKCRRHHQVDEFDEARRRPAASHKIAHGF